MLDSQDKETSTDEVQSAREYKKMPSGAWMSVCCECYVLSELGLRWADL